MKMFGNNQSKVAFASLAKMLAFASLAFGLSDRTTLAQSCAPTPTGLIASWSGEGNGLDSIGGLNATLLNGAGYGAGEVGAAFAFNGSNQYAQVPSSSKWAFGSADFSIELWVKLNSSAASQAFLACDAGPYGNNKWIFWLDNGALEMHVYIAGGAPTFLGSVPYSPSLNQWHHLAITRSGNNFTLYADGVVVSRMTSSVVIPDAGVPLTFGSAEGAYFLNGAEDEIAIYNRALSDTEIKSIYLAGGLGKCSGPVPPVVLTQPQSQTVYAGTPVTLSTLVSGSAPLSYQWVWNGTNLPTATSSTLVFANPQVSNSGAYALVVSNAYGMVTSAVATLTVNARACASLSNGLLGWWAGEGNGADSIGGKNATLLNGAGYVAGEVGLAFGFNGANQYAQVPSSPGWAFGTADFSIELWVKLNSSSASQAFLACDAGAYGNNKWIFWLDNGALELHVFNAGGGPTYVGSAPYSPSLNQWHHLAITRSGNNFTLYADGVPISRVTSSVVIPDAGAPLTFGSAEGAYFLNGAEDEITIYNRALTDNEISLIYLAERLGKCTGAVSPVVIAQPQSQNVFVGNAVTLSALISASAPVVYQWELNGTNLPAATASSLSLTNAQLTDSGAYTLVVSNAYGMVTTAVATLTVNARTCASLTNGLLGWWAGEGTAQDSFGTNHGAVVNGVGFVGGEVGQAFNLNANTNQYVMVPYNPALALGSGGNDFTIELWMRPVAGGGQPLVANDAGGAQYNQWAFSWNFGALEMFVANPSGAAVSLRSGAYSPALNQWHHVAVTRNGTVFSFYGDGVLLSTVSNSVAMPTPATPLVFGRAINTMPGYNHSPYYFNGAVDEIALYNQALSAADIAGIYNAAALGRCVTPASPTVVGQPTSKSVTENASTSLAAVASGVAPLGYQWQFNGNPLTGATNSTLTLPHVQLTNSGNYTILVSNPYGTTTSSVAILTVNPPTCASITNGLVSWWTAEGNTGDLAGTNTLTLVNGASYGSGETGQAFSFNGVNQYAQAAPSPAWGFGTNDFTIELWVNLKSSGNVAFLADDSGTENANKWIFWLNGGILQMHVNGPATGPLALGFGAFNPSLNQWHHVAVTRSGSAFTLYADGAVSSSLYTSESIPTPGVPMTLGAAEGRFFLNGEEDEVSIYNRALSFDEISSIYLAGNQGKCLPQVPPSILMQPQSQIVPSWTNVSFVVGAAGPPPLAYQWQLNGGNLSGATNASLSLTNVTGADAGNYSVIVTNLSGMVASSNAVLTVLPPPSLVQAGSVTATSAIVVVPITLRSLGTENALGYSVNFDASLLTFAAVAPGTGATNATAIFNTNSAAAGRLGIALALAGGGTFSAGTQEVAEVSFFVNSGTNPVVTPITFGDVPTARQVSDPLANKLASAFASGTVTIPFLGYEGDVAPLPNGDSVVTIIDWVQVGRFVAGLDTITNASEFQRVDCAPRGTYGDGQLTVADWVQAGRYAAGLDPLTVAGGPTVDVNGPMSFKQPVGLDFGPADSGRILKVVSAAAFPSQNCQVSVQLTALGNENGIGFSLQSDPAQVQLSGVTLGSGDVGANLIVNTNHTATNGVVAVLLSLPPGSVFSPGIYEVARLNFTVLPNASNSTNLLFTNRPTVSQVTDANAIALSTTYLNGAIIVGTLTAPTLRATALSGGLVLTWPVNALGYTVQSSTDLGSGTWTTVAATPVTNGSDQSVTLAVAPGAQRYYRLYHP